MNDHIDQPIFIIGCPRSGTTVALEIMALHPQLAWVSNYINRFPNRLQLSSLNRIYELPKWGKQLYLQKIGLKNMNQKWQQECSENEKLVLEQIIHEPEFRGLSNT